MIRVRSIFLSDIHLGTPACQAGRLLEFLRAHESQYLFLVGDIVDFWAIRRRGAHWTADQNTVVQKILKRARHGTEVIFVPGNHDEAAREHAGASFGNVRVENDYVHEAADGRRYLLTHGDAFDQVTRYHRWLAVLGDQAYDVLVRLNLWLSWVRRRLNIPGYWSLSGYAKRKVKSAVSFIFDFEDSLLHHARERGVDGVICGHIHAAALREEQGITYVNCGDWVDSCTAIVEHVDGRLELVHWGTVEAVRRTLSAGPERRGVGERDTDPNGHSEVQRQPQHIFPPGKPVVLDDAAPRAPARPSARLVGATASPSQTTTVAQRRACLARSGPSTPSGQPQ